MSYMGEPNTPAVAERKERDKRGSMVVEKVKGEGNAAEAEASLLNWHGIPIWPSSALR
jgi:hypothetical protein